jgi:hypothetical protein
MARIDFRGGCASGFWHRSITCKRALSPTFSPRENVQPFSCRLEACTTIGEGPAFFMQAGSLHHNRRRSSLFHAGWKPAPQSAKVQPFLCRLEACTTIGEGPAFFMQAGSLHHNRRRSSLFHAGWKPAPQSAKVQPFSCRLEACTTIGAICWRTRLGFLASHARRECIT